MGQVRLPGKRRRWLWSLTPWGRKALLDLERESERVAEIHAATLREQERYPEIARQAEVLEEAARRNGFVNHLTAGFQRPRTT